jgi:hypothetical protein
VSALVVTPVALLTTLLVLSLSLPLRLLLSLPMWLSLELMLPILLPIPLSLPLLLPVLLSLLGVLSMLLGPPLCICPRFAVVFVPSLTRPLLLLSLVNDKFVLFLTPVVVAACLVTRQRSSCDLK